MNYPDQIAELLQRAHTDLAQKLIAAGRVIAPGAQVEVEFNAVRGEFSLVVNSIPDPRLRKFALHAGYVRSQNDGDRHYIPAHRLVDLYDLKPGEYIFWDMKDTHSRAASDYRHLYPRSDGKYGRPDSE